MKRVDIYLDENQLSFLVGLTGTLSENIRKAVDDYIQKQKGINATKSLSKKGGK